MSKKITHEGEVMRISGDVVQVKIIQHSACATCSAKSSCYMSESKEQIVEIVDTGTYSFQPGEKVVIAGNASMGLKAVLYAFVLPLILLLVVTSIFLHILEDEIRAVISSLFFLIIYYIILYFLKDKIGKKFVFKLLK